MYMYVHTCVWHFSHKLKTPRKQDFMIAIVVAKWKPYNTMAPNSIPIVMCDSITIASCHNNNYCLLFPKNGHYTIIKTRWSKIWKS